jgi:outer membrane receptor protein involved in Fe transport
MAVVAVAGHEVLAQQAPTPQSPAKSGPIETPSEILQLSPFVVDTAADQGYHSAQTLAGSRVRTELKDVAPSVQGVTDAMLEDLGLTNRNDVLAYPNGGSPPVSPCF